MNLLLKYIGDNYPKVKVGVSYSNPYESLNKKTVRENLENVLRIYDYNENYIPKRVEDSFRITNVDYKYMDKLVSSLDYTEAKAISLTSALIHNPKVIILEDYTDTLINSDRKELSRLLRLLKNKYNKTIILFTKDTQFTYEISDQVFLLNDEEIVKYGDRYILKDIDLLDKLGLEVPNIISFISLCNKNGHEIGDYISILDLIKIYAS